MQRSSRFVIVTIPCQNMEEICVLTLITMKDKFYVTKQTTKVCSENVLLTANIILFKWRNNISRKDHFQILLSESGITDCKLISGEFISTQEQYMGRTNTAFECAREVKVIAPDADGMTWTLNSMECWAKYGSSNSTIDTNGCSYCQSCVFGIVFFLYTYQI